MSLRLSFGSLPSRARVVLALLALVVAGCQGGPETVEPAWLPGATTTLPEPVPPFSGERALEEARLLARHPHRAPGSHDADRAHAQIEEALRAIGAPPETWSLSAPPARDGDEPVAGRLILAVLPGQSDDLLLLLTHYDVGPDEGDDDADRVEAASGPAVLLELGRVLAARPRAYTVWLAFLEGDRSQPAPPDRDAAEADDAALARRFAATTAFADELDRRGDLARLRLVVYLDALARPDLHVARDLRSHRIHRETFWESARALDLQDVFSAEEPYSSPVRAHRALLARDLRAVVALVGAPPAPGDAEIEGRDSFAKDEKASRVATTARLDELGTVVLDALDRIVMRLSRIDGFATSPLAGTRASDAPGSTGEAASDASADGAGGAAPPPSRDPEEEEEEASRATSSGRGSAGSPPASDGPRAR